VSDKLIITKPNEVHIRIECDPHISQEISEYFTFEVPGARFMPAVRNKYWDGKIRLFNQMTRLIYAGLEFYITRFAKERGYDVEYQYDNSQDQFSLHEAKEFASTLDLPFKPRDYQIEAFAHAMRYKRGLLLSPTASGKSLIIYLVAKMMQRVLIVVPTTSLVHQMRSDFAEYGSKDTQVIMAGQSKDIFAHTTISTWQSIYKMPRDWFDQFDCVVGDEAHLFKSKSLSTLMEKLINCQYRIGTTGTLDGTQTHKLVLEGLFGPVKKVTSTKELMDDKHLAEFKIKCILLQYQDELRKIHSIAAYPDEMDFLVNNEKRNKFIENLTLSLDGNTLLLFQFVEKHGKVLYNNIRSVDLDRKVFFVHGGVDSEVRDQIRGIVENEERAIIIASYGTFSTGINIRNLHNIIFASPSKSRIRNLQSIGRGLRKGDNKSMATLFDIADDLKWKKKYNHTLKHFAVRLKTYDDEQFSYKIYKVKL
jgi:superfamily II DNA or RNA helicase